MKKKLTLVGSDGELLQEQPKLTREYMDEMGIPYINVPSKLIDLRHFFKIPVSVVTLGTLLYMKSVKSSNFPMFDIKEYPLQGFSKYQIKNGLQKLVAMNVLYEHKVKDINVHYSWNFNYLLEYSEPEKEILRKKGLKWLLGE